MTCGEAESRGKQRIEEGWLRLKEIYVVNICVHLYEGVLAAPVNIQQF